jgi:flagellar biosynthesis/type III secretory pathway protein FliH
VKEQLETEEAMETTIEKAYKEGYNKGYGEAKKKHLVTYPCSVCGKPIEITEPRTKIAVAKHIMEYGWGHVACHEMRKKG